MDIEKLERIAELSAGLCKEWNAVLFAEAQIASLDKVILHSKTAIEEMKRELATLGVVLPEEPQPTDGWHVTGLSEGDDVQATVEDCSTVEESTDTDTQLPDWAQKAICRIRQRYNL